MKLSKSLFVAGLSLCAFLLLHTAGAQPLTIPQDPKQKQEEEKEPQTESEKAKQKELEQKACGPDVNHKTETDKNQHPTPEPPADKALIYVVRPTMMGNKVQTKLAVDGKWVGINRGSNYFFFTLDPGEHYFCSQAENHSLLTVTVEAGKAYYFQQKIRMGFMKASNRLEQITEAEGTVALGKTHPSSFTEKK